MTSTSPEPSTAELVAEANAALAKLWKAVKHWSEWGIADENFIEGRFNMEAWNVREYVIGRLGDLRRAQHALARLEHLTQPASGAPDGWVLVPREPTPEMLHAAELAELPHDDWMAYWSGGYSAMLSAAPPPPPRQWSEGEIRALVKGFWRDYNAQEVHPGLKDSVAAMRAALSAIGQGSGDEG